MNADACSAAIDEIVPPAIMLIISAATADKTSIDVHQHLVTRDDFGYINASTVQSIHSPLRCATARLLTHFVLYCKTQTTLLLFTVKSKPHL